MGVKHFAAEDGRYLGAFEIDEEGQGGPDNGIEVPEPAHRRQIWDGEAWREPPAPAPSAVPVTRYFVDIDGRYLGAFESATPPDGAVEVAAPPVHARQIWDGSSWTGSPVPVPSSVTPLQARRALRQQSLHEAVTAWIAQQDGATQDAWEYATRIERDDAFIAGAAAALGLTDEQVDQLFILAATF